MAYRAVTGDLKLAYAQFEELESFARFGARLDESSRKIIEHGLRIRACLKQPDFSPVSVPAQMTILLALTAGLFDTVPVEKMIEAEKSVAAAAMNLPAAILARLDGSAPLNDADKQSMIEIARPLLVSFEVKPVSQLKPKANTDSPQQLAGKK
jgi:F-type H+-transporting ATPase subunit alpha